MVALGGTLTVIVCPSSILTRTWTSVLAREGCAVGLDSSPDAFDFTEERRGRADPELMLSPLLLISCVRRLVRLRRVARLVLRQSLMKVSGNFQRTSSMTPQRCAARSGLLAHPLFMAAVAAIRRRRRGHMQAIWKFMSKGDSVFKSVLSEMKNERRSDSSTIIMWDMRDGFRAFLKPTWWLYRVMMATGRMEAKLKWVVRAVRQRMIISAIEGQLGTKAKRARRDAKKRASAVWF